MKIYQCIHKYPPHIPIFEKKYGIAGRKDLTFEELRQLVIEDGYASSYILHPALEGKTDEVFYTIWDYERLQHLWAKENGLITNDLTEIKLAQVEEYAPDVIYDFSAFVDRDFVRKLPRKSTVLKCCWYSLINNEKPEMLPDYDVRISLHKPYINYWREKSKYAFELQAAIPHQWNKYCCRDRSVDILFYGQYFESLFSHRNQLVNELMHYVQNTDLNVNIHLQYNLQRKIIVPIFMPGLRRINKFGRIIYPSKFVRQYAKNGIYGDDLYSSIEKSKIVINAYGDYNVEYKSNMRLFESIGCGAFLISEEGNYPEGFIPGVDFYTYTDTKSLFTQIDKVLSDWPAHSKIAENTRLKITNLYSKGKQWERFKEHVSQYL
jgi:spore maturation protein CgeB